MASYIKRAALSSRLLLSLQSPRHLSYLSNSSHLASNQLKKETPFVRSQVDSDGRRSNQFFFSNRRAFFTKGKGSTVSDYILPLRRSFSGTTSQYPPITDPEIESAFKDLMAVSWDEIPDSVISNAKKAILKSTEDKVGQEALANVFRAAVASEEFGGVLVSLRMALDDLCGITGENVGPLPDYLEDAMKTAYNRYVTYLDSFGPDEAYLRKKVENELGTKMIHLKMRCSGIGSEWGKVTLLGTSGISGSYVEQRA